MQMLPVFHFLPRRAPEILQMLRRSPSQWLPLLPSVAASPPIGRKDSQKLTPVLALREKCDYVQKGGQAVEAWRHDVFGAVVQIKDTDGI